MSLIINSFNVVSTYPIFNVLMLLYHLFGDVGLSLIVLTLAITSLLNWFTFLNSAWHISLGVPDPTHILPILAGVMTFVQMRMSQPHAIAEIQDATLQLTQFMQFILPLIMVVITIFIAWQLAAGLALYRTTSLLLNMIQQYFVTGRGSLFAVPHVGGIPDNGGLKNGTQRQQTQPRHRSSSSRGSVQSKGAYARRHKRGSKKNRRRD